MATGDVSGRPSPGESAHRTFREHYRRHIRGTGREARFLIALAFLITFGIVRFITYSIRYHWLPFLHDSVTGSTTVNRGQAARVTSRNQLGGRPRRLTTGKGTGNVSSSCIVQ